jgi:hypothetical protein
VRLDKILKYLESASGPPECAKELHHLLSVEN